MHEIYIVLAKHLHMIIHSLYVLCIHQCMHESLHCFISALLDITAFFNDNVNEINCSTTPPTVVKSKGILVPDQYE